MRLLGVVKRLRLELFAMNNRVYIASIKSIFPKGYHPDIAVDVLYPADKAGEKLNLYAKRVARALGLKKRYSVLDADFFPKKKLFSTFFPKKYISTFFPKNIFISLFSQKKIYIPLFSQKTFF